MNQLCRIKSHQPCRIASTDAAIIACPWCGWSFQISALAGTCPHCQTKYIVTEAHFYKPGDGLGEIVMRDTAMEMVSYG